jgi:hypothetical protein
MTLPNLFHQFLSLQEYTNVTSDNLSQYVAANRYKTTSSSSDLPLVVILFNNAFLDCIIVIRLNVDLFVNENVESAGDEFVVTYLW